MLITLKLLFNETTNLYSKKKVRKDFFCNSKTVTSVRAVLYVSGLTKTTTLSRKEMKKETRGRIEKLPDKRSSPAK